MSEETKVKIVIKPNQQGIEGMDVLESLFKISKHSENKTFADKAYLLLEKAAAKGDEGLFSSDWKKMAEELELKQFQYFHVLKTLKDAGLLVKTHGKLYLTRKFANHMDEYASAANRMMNKFGVKRQK